MIFSGLMGLFQKILLNGLATPSPPVTTENASVLAFVRIWNRLIYVWSS